MAENDKLTAEQRAEIIDDITRMLMEIEAYSKAGEVSQS